MLEISDWFILRLGFPPTPPNVGNNVGEKYENEKKSQNSAHCTWDNDLLQLNVVLKTEPLCVERDEGENVVDIVNT